MLETREQPYGLAVRSNHCLRVWAEEGLEETHPAAMADALARGAWATHAAGDGAAGVRWTIEECFERAKDDLGLDHCEARSWHGWHRHMSLCLAAAAFLARLAADLRRATWGKANERSPAVPAAA